MRDAAGRAVKLSRYSDDPRRDASRGEGDVGAHGHDPRMSRAQLEPDQLRITEDTHEPRQATTDIPQEFVVAEAYV